MRTNKIRQRLYNNLFSLPLYPQEQKVISSLGCVLVFAWKGIIELICSKNVKNVSEN